MSLRFSNSRGASWHDRRMRSLGAGGNYRATPMWWSFGEARDGVFELSWSTPMKTAVQSVFVDFSPAET